MAALVERARAEAKVEAARVEAREAREAKEAARARARARARVARVPRVVLRWSSSRIGMRGCS